MDDLFHEFPPQSLEQWIALAEKDLRGKPLSDLSWQLEEDVVLRPFYHADDQPVAPKALREGSDPAWSLGEFVQVREQDEAIIALEAAADSGVDALLLVLYRHLDKGDLAALLENIDLSKHSIHFTEYYSDKNPEGLVRQFLELAIELGYNLSKLHGSIDLDPILDWNEPPYDRLHSLFDLCRRQMPHFRLLQVNGLHLHAGPEESSRELALILAKGSTYLHEMQERGVPLSELLPHMQFNLALSSSFFVEVAKLRAFRMLWANVLEGYGVLLPPPPFVIAHLARDSQVEDVHLNMVRAAIQALSGIIGGADRLYIRPADYYLTDSSTPFTRRMARNLQHILELESHLGRVSDPAAGSYYLEKLTAKLSLNAWSHFQQIEAEEGF